MKLTGIIPAMVTLFKDDQEIDEEAIRDHIDFLIDAKVHGIFVLGSTGEFAYLSEDEKKQVIEIAAEQINGKIPLIAGISSPSTKIATELAKFAEEKGANAVMAVIPTYFPLENKNIEIHYEKIAASIEIPLYAYNFTLTTRIDLSPKLIAKLAEKKVLAGIKETVIDISHVQQMIDLTPDEFCVLCGTELLLKEGLKARVDGAILGMGNCFPNLLVQIWESFQKGRSDEFESLWSRFSTILPFLNQPMDYLPSLVKEILVLEGRNLDPQVRIPLRVIPERLKNKLSNLEIIKNIIR
ncbi:MAG TPA: dihydrodipicolinate synthase family protein [Candidatus Deferrimicrobium sp.]|nr:dihydrodipicolinate synthase family protein [Candidatus Deferrimicrobium sp.]